MSRGRPPTCGSLFLFCNVALLLINVMLLLSRGARETILKEEQAMRRKYHQNRITPLAEMSDDRATGSDEQNERLTGAHRGENEGEEGKSFYGTLLAQKNTLQKDLRICDDQQKELRKTSEESLRSEKLCRALLMQQTERHHPRTVVNHQQPEQPQSQNEDSNTNKGTLSEAHQSSLFPQPARRKPWLIIGIPTVPRRHESHSTPVKQTLLFRTLNSMIQQIKGTIFEPDRLELAGEDGKESRIIVGSGGVRIVVKSNRPGEHPVFTACKKYFMKRSRKLAHIVRFVEGSTDSFAVPVDGSGRGGGAETPPRRYEDTPKPFAKEFANSNKERPTPFVRRQTLDVVSLLDHAVDESKYFYFTEDDFEFCPNTLMALHYMITKANRYQGEHQWAGIRCSFGLNGIIMHNESPSPDLKIFRDYLLEHFNRRPPDHLVVEFYAKESQQAAEYFGSKRHVMAFRYNVGNHIGGRQSTLRDEDAWSFPGCFTELIAPQVFPVEAWNPLECPDDDIWPCKYPGNPSVAPSVLIWNSSDTAQVSKYRDVYLRSGEKRKKGTAGHRKRHRQEDESDTG